MDKNTLIFIFSFPLRCLFKKQKNKCWKNLQKNLRERKSSRKNLQKISNRFQKLKLNLFFLSHSYIDKSNQNPLFRKSFSLCYSPSRLHRSKRKPWLQIYNLKLEREIIRGIDFFETLHDSNLAQPILWCEVWVAFEFE